MKLLQKVNEHAIRSTGASLLALILVGASIPTVAATSNSYDYSLALTDSIIFYDANKCGTDVANNNEFSWRSACHIHDGSDKGIDLTGGFHDCGDHAKFGITQNYAASILGWSYLEYKDVYTQTGNSTKMYDTLKYFTDYLLKCHPNSNTFYYQLGDGNTDHSYWGSPELQGDRVTYFTVDSNTAGSDITGGASAALSIMYINSKDKDPAYAAKCLSAAKSLYVLGTSKEGIAPYQSFYPSSSYKDDLAWAATWLYKATGESKYLADAEKYITSPYNSNEALQNNWTLCWDDVSVATNLELYKITKNDKYKNAVAHNINHWYNMQPTAGGLKVLDSWGCLRYSAAASAVAMQYYEITGDTKAKDLALSQINYILGDNPNNMSYIIGFGDKYPAKPHHRAANGYQGYQDGNNLKPAQHLLTGALVGGPGNGDSYSDDPNSYSETEVGIDYNAGLVMALAAILNDGNETITPSPSPTPTPSPMPSPSPTPSPTPSPSPTPDTGSDSEVTIDGIDVNVKTTQSGNTLSQQYTLTSRSSQTIDLSKLAIRFYFTSNNNVDMNFWCDYASLQLNSDPWYETITSNVKGKIGQDSKGKYIEITFTGNSSLKQKGNTLSLQTRSANVDWSNFSNFAEKDIVVSYDKSNSNTDNNNNSNNNSTANNNNNSNNNSTANDNNNSNNNSTANDNNNSNNNSTANNNNNSNNNSTANNNNNSNNNISNNSSGTNSTVDGVNINVKTTLSDNTLSQEYQLTSTTSKAIDLSKLAIRFYFNTNDSIGMNFWCDHAAVQFNSAPWYESMTSNVNGIIGSDSKGKYIEITFNGNASLKQSGDTLIVQTRCSNTDWSNLSNFTEKDTIVSYK